MGGTKDYPNRSGMRTRRAILASFQVEDSAIAEAAQTIAPRPTRPADRENLANQQAMLVEIHDAIRKTSEMILSS
jgi:hypothetical protein